MNYYRKDKIIDYGSILKEQEDIKLFLKSIGSMKCRCMIVFKTLWEKHSWLVKGYYPNDEKIITNLKYPYVEVYNNTLDKKILVSIEDILEIQINEDCHIILRN